MSLIDHTPETDSPEVPARPDMKRRQPRWRVALRTAGIVVASLVILALASTLANAAITNSEKATLAPYGQKVSIEAGDINVYRNGGSGPTMVLLSGFGTPAPAVDFAPLIRKLDAFDVIVIEGFGYGYSDLNVPNRTIENITGEIHEVLGRLGVTTPVILLGHSVGGLYTHYYANAYPGGVSAIIGIDPMTAKASSLEVGQPSTIECTLVGLGLMRVATAIAPSIIQPPGTAYTKHEREQTAAMTNWNYGNESVSDEWAQIGANSTKASARPIPANIPVLEFLSTASVDSDPSWLRNHQAELAGVATHELEVLDGAHYLQWTQSPAMANTISAFIAAHVTHQTLKP
jgi:pimeloyl-ACP methyl ester carboxylesterase